ncbi:MAG TPA: response regulator transcription factor [Dinghuibacter sp.]|uniref:LytR/AlgR family response regulator transcription factor n=1 Tax=Dinghuibacter sp. TaxID=2024697 RepID=UPI002C71B3B8|nr:response regulator transcription factor [Dinghuibacter sp.]HTJ11725.1 response regulator transcription factor [Dinghuibacter sp.]
MLQCIAVDDEPLALHLLEDYLTRVPDIRLVAKCGDAFEAGKILRSQPIDLMFLDIQMPGLSGLQFIESLAQKPMVILVTAYEQFALEGYTLDVVDYLLKPVELDRFLKACNKAWELHQLRLAGAQATKSPGYFFVNADYSLLKIQFEDISWIEGLRDYIKIHLKGNNRPVVVRMSVKGVEAELPAADFIRVHKSYIVSIKDITAIRKNSVFIKDQEIPVGDTYRDTLIRLTGRSIS